MQSTNNSDIKYLIQQVAPTFLSNMDRAHALSEKF